MSDSVNEITEQKNVKNRFIWYSALTLFLLFGIQGLLGTYNQMSYCDTAGKVVQTIALFGYGITGLAGAFLLYRRGTVHISIQICWSVCIIVAAGAAPVVWAGAPLFTGLFSAVGGAVIVGVILWLVRHSRVDR